MPVARIRRLAGTGRQGTSLYGLMEAAGKLGFRARGVKAVKEESLEEIPLPAIFHLQAESGLQHFVVVYRARGNRVDYMDPASGKMVRQPPHLFRKQWSGMLLLLMPEAHFRPGDHREPVFGRLRKLAAARCALLLPAAGAGLAYTVLGLIQSIYTGRILDLILSGGDLYRVNRTGLIMLAILLCRVLAGYGRSLLVLRAGQQLDAVLTPGYYRHLMRLPQSFFDSMQAEEILSRFSDAAKVRTFISDTALQLAAQLSGILFILAALLLYCPELALPALLMLPVCLLLQLVRDRLHIKAESGIMEQGSALESHLLESIRGIRSVRRLGLEAYCSRLTGEKCRLLMQAISRAARTGFTLEHAVEFSARLSALLVCWAGARFVVDGILSPGALLTAYLLTGRLAAPVRVLAGSGKSIREALAAADRLFEITGLEAEADLPGAAC
jgi:ATP-binding cassette subfamily B protein